MVLVYMTALGFERFRVRSSCELLVLLNQRSVLDSKTHTDVRIKKSIHQVSVTEGFHVMLSVRGASR